MYSDAIDTNSFKRWQLEMLTNSGGTDDEVAWRVSFTFFLMKSRYYCAEKSAVTLDLSSPSSMSTDFQVVRTTDPAADIFDFQ